MGGDIKPMEKGLQQEQNKEVPHFTIHPCKKPRINANPAVWEADMKQKRENYISRLVNEYKMSLGFMNRDEDPTIEDDVGPEYSSHGAAGLTIPLGLSIPGVGLKTQKLAVYWQVTILECLFHHNPTLLPDCEAFGAQFYFAATAVHEIMHALFRVMMDDLGWNLFQQMERQVHLKDGAGVVERGFEWESAVSSYSLYLPR